MWPLPAGAIMKQGDDRRTGLSRRRLLGAGAAGLAAGSAGLMPGLTGVASAAAGTPPNSAYYGRIFGALKPFADVSSKVTDGLMAVGQRGGIMDALDNLAAGPVALITDPTVNGNPTSTNAYGTNPDNPTMTAGSTFVGQFIDHDITFDQTSQLGVSQDPLTSPNARTPTLDLDSVFGGGQGIRPDLYVSNPDGTIGPELRIGSGGVHEDVPRTDNGDGTYSAIIGDPRNDENLMIAGLHCAHILFYNRVLSELGSINLSPYPAAQGADLSNIYDRFRVARQITLWHYQWLLVNEHLPQIAGRTMVSDVLTKGNKFYKPPIGNAFMPIEFAAACYRFGHSVIRPSYRCNFTSGTGDSPSPSANPFFALVFDASKPNFSGPIDYDRDDLLGGYPAARRYIGWQTFFDFGDGQVKHNKKIDTKLSSAMFDLPTHVIAPPQKSPAVLPQRNLLRQLTWSLPSGQEVAKAMKVPPLKPEDMGGIKNVYDAFGKSTPLWYYILAEAKTYTNGVSLGPVGGRIVTETLIGLLRADPTSYLSANPGWTPFLGAGLQLGPNLNPNIIGNRSYTRAHFLYYAQVVTPGTYR